MVVVRVLVDTGDAMGANAVNSLVETLAPTLEEMRRRGRARDRQRMACDRGRGARARRRVTDGIQAGHMALHARAVSPAAGARGADAEELERRLVRGGDVKLARARELLRAMGT